jgi:hypothetical protein
LPKPGGLAVEDFIHRENLALFRKRLAEPHDDAERKVLLKLLAEEEAKDLPQSNDLAQGKTN